MTRLPSAVRPVGISLGILLAGYLVFTATNTLLFFLRLPVPMALDVVAPFLSGLAVGILTAMFFAREATRPALLATLLALAPTLFSWFVAGAMAWHAQYTSSSGLPTAPTSYTRWELEAAPLAAGILAAGLAGFLGELLGDVLSTHRRRASDRT